MQWLAFSQIKSSNPQRRLEAIARLSHVHDIKAMVAVAGALTDRSPDVRLAAVQALGKFRDERCVGTLIPLLQDPDARVREAAVLALKWTGHPASVPYLVPLLRDAEAAVRSSAARALPAMGWTPESEAQQALHFVASGQFGKASALGAVAIEPLLGILSDSNATRRRDAVEALAPFRESRVIEALLQMLNDSDPGVRIAALSGLGHGENPAHAEVIARYLEDPDKNVRACAVEVVSRIRHPDPVSLLVTKLTDPEWVVRVAAVCALGASGNGAVVEPLARVLSDPDHDVREAAASALGRSRERRAIQPLVLAQLDPESGVRHAAQSALNRIDLRWATSEEARQTLGALKKASRSSNYWVRQSALDLLQRIFSICPCDPIASGHEDHASQQRGRVVKAIAGLLWDNDPLLRFAAVSSLARIGDRRALGPLSARRDDADEFVRESVAAALVQLGNEASARNEICGPAYTPLDSWAGASA